MNIKCTNILFALIIAVTSFSCKKNSSDPEPTNANYDVANSVFRTYANASSAMVNVTITQTRPSSDVPLFGSVKSQLYSQFDYGFTPAIGDTIKVNVTSPSSVYVHITYLAEDLLVTTQKATNGLASATFQYVVKQ